MVNQIDFAGDTEQTETPSVTSQGHEQEFAGLGSAAVTPLIGRNAELRLLEDRWEQAQEGQSQIVLVLGEAGLGKSRLVRTIVRQIRETSVSADQPGSQVVEWRCAEHFQNSELHPVSDFMNRFLGFGADDSPSARFERLARHLEDYGLSSPEGVGLFAKLLFLPEDDRYLAGGLTPAREREETFRVVRQWLDACSAKRPTLFIIEDLHWSDASTLEFLSQLIEAGKSGQILTVLTFRPEFKVPWPAAAQKQALGLMMQALNPSELEVPANLGKSLGPEENRDHNPESFETSADYLFSPQDGAREIASDHGTHEVYVITNNHYKGKSVANALMMKSMLSGERVPAPSGVVEAYSDVVEPYTVPVEEGAAASTN